MGGWGYVLTSRRSGCPSKMDDGAGDAHQGSSEAALTFKQGRLATRPLKNSLECRAVSLPLRPSGGGSPVRS